MPEDLLRARWVLDLPQRKRRAGPLLHFKSIASLHLNRGFPGNDRYRLLLGVVRVHLQNL